MRFVGLAFLCVSALLAPRVHAATAVNSLHPNQTPALSTLDRFFSSDGPESLHESKNQGTVDEPKAWPEPNAWLHSQLTDAEREFLTLSVTGPSTSAPTLTATTQAPATTAAPIPYCTQYPTACLNGGTCINGSTAGSYSCSCASAFIGVECQYYLFGTSKRSSSSSVPRGKSITRPNVSPPKPSL